MDCRGYFFVKVDKMRYPTTSKTLIDKLRDGDAVSWDEFYDRYHDIIFDIGKYRGLSDDECKDLVQEVMLRFFQKAKTFTFDPGIAKFRTYFSKIVSGKIVDILRKRLKTVSDISSELDNNMGVQESPDVELDRCILFQWRILILAQSKEILKNRVDGKTFAAFELYGEQNRNINKVSEALGMSANQIYVAKSRCLKILAGIINEMNIADPELGLSL